MTQRSRQDLDRLERSLVATYRALPVPELGQEWARQVMHDVRREAAKAAGSGTGWVELHVWRTAALAAAVALVFAGSLFFSAGVDVGKGELSALLSEELEPAPALLD